MKKNHLGIMYGLIAGLLWSLTFLAPKMSAQFSSTEILIGRYFIFFIISLALFPIQKMRQFFKDHPDFFKEALICSLLGFSGYYFILVESVRRIGVPFPSFMMGLVPITMILFSGDFFKNLKVYYLTILCGLSGMLILAYQDLFHFQGANLSSEDIYVGVLTAFLALASWTYYALRNVAFLKRHPEIESARWSSVIGALSLPTTLLCLMLECIFRKPDFYIFRATTSETNIYILCILAIGLGSSWLATYFWNKAGGILSRPMLGQMIVSETSFAVLFNAVFERRMLSHYEIIAIILLSAGVAFAARQKT